VVDYFDESFDENKNCKHEAEMKQLMDEKDDNHEMRRCATVSFSGDHITEAHSWEECKKRTSQKLNHEACNGMGFEDHGKLFYCKDRGRTSCCFAEEKCIKFFNSINSAMYRKALYFKQHTKDFLKTWVEQLGFDTCHKIDNYNVDKCHADCKKQEKSKFAKKCKKDGGLFKCCIRRDKEYCHECRYCCTLSVCTMKDEVTYYHFTNNSLGTAVAENHITDAPDAAHGFSTDNRLYKNYDFRCLKPKSGVDSSKWPHYEMKGFRKANTKKELNKVQEIPHDINFFNFEDPKVFKEFTKGKDTQIWKKTYGFDKTFRVDGKELLTRSLPGNVTSLVDSSSAASMPQDWTSFITSDST